MRENLFMNKLKDTLLDLLQAVIVALIIVFICFKFLFISAVVDGNSMYPTLHDGDRGFSFIITKNIEIKRFDICVVDSDNLNYLLVKRVIGLPNETIEYKDNKLYVNGEYIKEDFLNDDVLTYDFSITLGDDEYFCLGDNRTNSSDSRVYGAFSKEEIKSTKFLIYWPFSDIGFK